MAKLVGTGGNTKVTGGYIVLSQSASVRSDSSRFLSKVHAGAGAAATEMAEEIRDFAKIYAPYRQGGLKKSIIAKTLGTEGFAIATAKHAAPQETGSSAHGIGSVGQPLINRGEGMYPGWSGTGIVWHPGNPATKFMTRAGLTVKALSPGIVRKHMPGG